ncbi:lysophosphatidylserine lipase ABHD12-like [Falco rusticolus]|uniref:lysophosphatidylserine lipase ABHD12-like n=1 Tax=Falco rusticolus TaxID=120794 RepID=UPI0018865B68|nr:lysophosphatidylserine lipase ABHD12-like [Falco rusticolus]XP_055572913.1 lysophosphatidylserine lipase ABHD12 [Falco cherrug]
MGTATAPERRAGPTRAGGSGAGWPGIPSCTSSSCTCFSSTSLCPPHLPLPRLAHHICIPELLLAVPSSRGAEARGKDQRWYEEALADAHPVIIYLHGCEGTRAVSHCVQFLKIYRQFPGCEYFILDLLALRNMFFCSDKNVKVLTCPLLILHAEDDAVLPLHLGHKLFETAHSTYKDKTKVKFITFPKKLGLGHNYISFSLELPTLVKNFLDI